jgi:hypothetical protein
MAVKLFRILLFPYSLTGTCNSDDREHLMEERELVRKYVVAYITDGCFVNRRDSVGVFHLPLPITQSSAT